MHDALAEVCDRLLRSSNAVPDSGGTPATVIINLDLADVLAKTGWAVASDGTLIKTETALAAADQADLYWAVKDSAGQILQPGPDPADRFAAANHRPLRQGPRLLIPGL